MFLCSCPDALIKNTTNFKKEAYRDGIKRKGDKIGMGWSTCFTYDFHIVSVLTFLESTTQSLYCHLVCLSQTLLLCRNSELGSHTAPSHLPVTVHCYSNADFHSGGTGSQPLCDGVSTSQHDGQCRAYFSPRQQYRDCVVNSGNVMTLTM